MSTLESAIADLYRGPLEDFVSRRDALAKELRGTGNREDATTVKALRKPSRAAWALNLAVLEEGDAMETLIAAIRQTIDVQSAGGDVRASIAAMRTAAREFASSAADAARRGGHVVDAGALANALFAVLGKTESFEQLRKGVLTDVPEAGGLDLLTALPALPDAAARPAAKPAAKVAKPAGPPAADAARSASAGAAKAAKPSGVAATKAPGTGKSASPASAPAEAPSSKRAAVEAAARQAVEKAKSALTSARERSDGAHETLRLAETRVRTAEARLKAAEEELRLAQGERDRARKALEVATGDLTRAERAAADAAKRLQNM